METVAQARLRETAAFIDMHLAELPELSQRDETSAHEAELRKVAASHREFLEFVRWHLRVPLWYSEKADGPEHFAPGHFHRFMLRMAMKPKEPSEVALEYGEPIQFLHDGIDMPSSQDFRTTVSYRNDHAPEGQKDY
ncbi:hypothetical protein G6L37_06830 [Agrobacterium rubi]|nr:hypothetical protein [Agrobacterium rubi]NTF25079.1 hypothetical protein [Agrobacterium rubi]